MLCGLIIKCWFCYKNRVIGDVKHFELCKEKENDYDVEKCFGMGYDYYCSCEFVCILQKAYEQECSGALEFGIYNSEHFCILRVLF